MNGVAGYYSNAIALEPGRTMLVTSPLRFCINETPMPCVVREMTALPFVAFPRCEGRRVSTVADGAGGGRQQEPHV